MRYSIRNILVYTGLVAVQVQSSSMMAIGLLVSGLVLMIGIPLIMISALGSPSQNGRLAVEENIVFRMVQRMLGWCVLNCLTLFMLFMIFPHLSNRLP